LFVLSLTAAQTAALKPHHLQSDILIRQGSEVFRRVLLQYCIETPKTAWGDATGLVSTPDPVFEFRDGAADVIQLPGGLDISSAIAAGIAGHVAAANPHPEYRTKEQAFATPALTWIFNHNLGYYPIVQPVNLARQPIDADVLHMSTNQVQVGFSTPFSGYILYS
jgi:hypothetical protein